MLDAQIIELANHLKHATIERRRNFHRYPETAWTEFRTASIIADTLTDLGYTIYTGSQVIDRHAMLGVPKAITLAEHRKRAQNQGANPLWLEKMADGKTGVMGVFKFRKPGPTVALRFEMDANKICEAQNFEHLPYKEGFSSINKGIMHACGHDGHVAIGLTIAEILMELKTELCGTIKLIFQPAQEGVRGAKAMVNKKIVDDVDYMIGTHLGLKLNQTGTVACNVQGFLATSKFDVEFIGTSAHAGIEPEAGSNALLAAACATLNLHAISRHSDGTTRINVGILHGGSDRNIIAANSILKFETRGTTIALNQYVVNEAFRIIEAAAKMYDVTAKITKTGDAPSSDTTVIFSNKISQIAKRLHLFHNILPKCSLGASEDFVYFMNAVQENGCQSAYIIVGANLASGHHDSYFDFDETALDLTTKLIATTVADLLTNN